MFVGCPAFYVLWRVLPYLVFYVAPFLLIGTLAGVLWKSACSMEPANSRRLAFLFPLSAGLLLFFLGFPSTQCRVPLMNAELESASLCHAFNDMKAWLDGVINWSWLSYYRFLFPVFLPPERYQAVLYDLRDLSWVLWLGLFTLAPAVFLFLGSRDEKSEISRIVTEYEQKVRREQAGAFELRKELDRERASAKSAMQEKDKEIEKLKAVVQAATETLTKPGGSTPTSEDPPKGGGVFGSDFL